MGPEASNHRRRLAPQLTRRPLAGLVAVGIPNDTAVSAALLYRMVSYYLPPIWGWFALQWLRRQDYV